MIVQVTAELCIKFLGFRFWLDGKFALQNIATFLILSKCSLPAFLCQVKANNAAMHLLEHYIASGAIEQGVQVGRRLLSFDPLQESMLLGVDCKFASALGRPNEQHHLPLKAAAPLRRPGVRSRAEQENFHCIFQLSHSGRTLVGEAHNGGQSRFPVIRRKMVRP